MWWQEILFVYAFYFVYSRIRGKRQGIRPASRCRTRAVSSTGNATSARTTRLSFQRLVLTNDQMIVALNTFYGTAHFMVTPAVAIFLFRSVAMCTACGATCSVWTTALALVGLLRVPADAAAPRARCSGSATPWCRHPSPWKVTPIPIWNIGNPYAAMPSLHVAWSIWVCLALLATTRSIWIRLARHACIRSSTLVAIVATGNHYVLDAVGGALALALAMALLPVLSRCPAGGGRHRSSADPSAFLPGDDEPRRLQSPVVGQLVDIERSVGSPRSRSTPPPTAMPCHSSSSIDFHAALDSADKRQGPRRRAHPHRRRSSAREPT